MTKYKMKEIIYKLDTPKNIADTDKKIFLELLIQEKKSN